MKKIAKSHNIKLHAKLLEKLQLEVLTLLQKQVLEIKLLRMLRESLFSVIS